MASSPPNPPLPPEVFIELHRLIDEAKRGDIDMHAERVDDHLNLTTEYVFRFRESMYSVRMRQELHRFIQARAQYQPNPPVLQLHSAMAQSAASVSDQMRALMAILRTPAPDKLTAKPPPPQELGVSEELLVGYRDFQVKDGVLTSRNGHEWPAREKHVATCTILGEHHAPVRDCACGIYSFTRPDHKDLRKSDLADVYGEIYVWGDTYICETGYRSQYAYPKSLFVKDDGTRKKAFLTRWLEDEYGVPVFPVSTRSYQTSEEYMGTLAQAMLEAKRD
jgi:hypothetical protein